MNEHYEFWMFLQQDFIAHSTIFRIIGPKVIVSNFFFENAFSKSEENFEKIERYLEKSMNLLNGRKKILHIY